MRDGVFQILLKFFVGALDQQLLAMSLPNKRREIGQRQAGNQLLPSRPDQLLFVTRKFFSLPTPLIAVLGANKYMRFN